jgi:hypothetical protein
MASDAPVSSLGRGRRWAVRGILTLATLLLVVAIFAVWANRQVLDADNWASTSSELLENQEIRTQVSGFLVDQVYESVDVTAELAAALPPRLDPLAGPAANGLRQLAEQRTERLLGRPKVQEAWESANRVAVEQFIAIVDGESEAVTLSGNDVVLNLRVVVEDVVRQLGGSGRLISKVPQDAGQITVMSSDSVSLLQDAVSAVRGLSAFLPGIAILLFALAVYLSPGRRRRVLMFSGFGFIVAGLLVLVGRNVAEGYVVDALASTASIEPAVEAVWAIGTEMLRDVAQATVVMGIPVVAAAWVAGPTRPAVGLRRAAAPWLRTRPAVAYGVLAAVLLLVVAWGPIPATRMVLPVLLMIGLSAAGLEVLRRQVAVEFPEVSTHDVRDGMKAQVRRAVSAMSGARSGNGATPSPQPAVSHIDELERLATLHERGALSDEEYLAEKKMLTGVAANGG